MILHKPSITGSEVKFVHPPKTNEPAGTQEPRGFVMQKTAIPRHSQTGHTWAKSALSGTFSEIA